MAAADRLVEHPTLDALRSRAEGRGLVEVVAAPGWGRTSLLQQWAAAAGVEVVALRDVHRDPVALAATLLPDDRPAPGSDDARDVVGLADRVAAALHEDGSPVLVVDDVERLAGSDGLALLRALGAERDDLLLVAAGSPDAALAGPRELGAGRALLLDAGHLALDVARVDALLQRELDDPDDLLATRVVAATAGWPAAVRLVVDALHDVPAAERVRAVDDAVGDGGPVADYVRAVVVPSLRDHHDALVEAALVGHLPSTAPDRRSLLRLGLVLGTDGGQRVLPPLATVLRRDALAAPARPGDAVERAATSLQDTGAVGPALRLLLEAGRHDRVAQLLALHGHGLLLAGDLELLDEVLSGLPARQRSADLRRLHGQVLGYRGDWRGALEHLEAAGAGPDGPLPAGLALDRGLVQHLRGDLAAAVAEYARGADADDVDAPALAAWASTATWLTGDVDTAARLADRAVAGADPADDRLASVCHTALALVAASRGDRRANEHHHDEALAAALRAGDRLQEARIRTNRGSRLLEEGAHDEALAETERALDLADEQGFTLVRGVARCNRSEALLALGRLDEAAADADTGRELFSRVGSRLEAYAHRLLGDVRREQGDLVLAANTYRHALRLASDRQGRVPPLLGLVRVLLGEDDDEAAACVERAAALDDGMAAAGILLARGWLALAGGERAAARQQALLAREEAGRRSDLAAVAEATTLLAVLDEDPLPGLREAAAAWWDLGARISATRVELGLARRSRDEVERALAPQLEQRLRDWGCALGGAAFGHQVVAGPARRVPLSVRLFGGFSVEREGRPVPASTWGSRKARDVLKVLAVRDGATATREELGHLLWPDEPYDAVSNRLSVALSVLRGVLAGPDGDRDTGPLRTDGVRVALDVAAVDVDLLRFRRLADDGLALLRRGEGERAEVVLRAAEDAYGGDLLEADDEPWLLDARAEVRSLYVSVTRALADLVGQHDPDRAMRLLLRVLARDPYDEGAHVGICRALVRSGRHGEARRRHGLYRERMRELGLEPIELRELVDAG